MYNTKNRYVIHDDLSDGKEGVVPDFCVHVYIVKKDQLLMPIEEDFASGESGLPKVRSGTVTFVKYNDDDYAVTCHHVINELDSSNAELEKNAPEYYSRPMPDIAKYHLFTAIGEFQYHLNTVFHRVEEGFSVLNPDISIARIPPGFLKDIGRRCVSLSDFPGNDVLDDDVLTGIACGFTEEGRSLRTNGLGQSVFGKAFVSAKCRFNTFSEQHIRLFENIEDHKGVNVLSGMSGGPLFWSVEDKWGLAGIVTDGGDLKPRYQDIEDEDDDQHRINIVAQPLHPDNFSRWIENLPEYEPISSLSSRLHIPNT